MGVDLSDYLEGGSKAGEPAPTADAPTSVEHRPIKFRVGDRVIVRECPGISKYDGRRALICDVDPSHSAQFPYRAKIDGADRDGFDLLWIGADEYADDEDPPQRVEGEPAIGTRVQITQCCEDCECGDESVLGHVGILEGIDENDDDAHYQIKDEHDGETIWGHKVVALGGGRPKPRYSKGEYVVVHRICDLEMAETFPQVVVLESVDHGGHVGDGEDRCAQHDLFARFQHGSWCFSEAECSPYSGPLQSTPFLLDAVDENADDDAEEDEGEYRTAEQKMEGFSIGDRVQDVDGNTGTITRFDEEDNTLPFYVKMDDTDTETWLSEVTHYEDPPEFTTGQLIEQACDEFTKARKHFVDMIFAEYRQRGVRPPNVAMRLEAGGDDEMMDILCDILDGDADRTLKIYRWLLRELTVRREGLRDSQAVVRDAVARWQERHDG